MTPQEALKSGQALTNGKIPTATSTTDQYGTPVTNTAIPVPTVTNPISPVQIPPAGIPSPYPNFTGDINGINQYIQSLTQPTKDTTGDAIFNQLLSDISGETPTQLQERLRKEQGVTEKQARLNSLLKQFQNIQTKATAVPEQIQQQFAGRGVTTAGLAPIEAAQKRSLYLESLPVALEANILQGDIQTAEKAIETAVTIQFEERQQRNDLLREAYNRNKDLLDRQDKQKSQALNIALNERDRLLEQQKVDKTEIFNIGKLATQYGAPQSVVSSIIKSNSREEALQYAGKYLEDPVAKQALKNSELEYKLKQLQINKTAYEFDLLQKYGGMTPAQFADSLKAQQKEIADAKTEKEKNILQGQALLEKSTLLSTILKSSGLNSVVGTNVLTRGKTVGVFGGAGAGAILGSSLGPVGTVLGGIIGGGTSYLLGGNIDQITGSAQNTISMTEQFISKEFLDALIDVKAKGATFGALQKAEQDALTAAATKIGFARMCSGGGQGTCKEGSNVIGYNMSEKDFKEEIQKIQFYTNLSYYRATGELIPNDTASVLDEVYGSENDFTPGGW